MAQFWAVRRSFPLARARAEELVCYVAYSYKFVLVLRARYFMLECSCQIVLQTANSIVLELVSLQYKNYVHVRAEEALKSDIVTSNPTRSQISVPLGSNLRRICRSEEHSTNALIKKANLTDKFVLFCGA